MKYCIIPIDNRPVCYGLARDIAKIDENIELFIPPRGMLGDLKKSADIIGLHNWLCQLPEVDVIILSLDTLAYGGLIPSRRCPETFEEIKSRMIDFKNVLKAKNAKIYAVSSIMRISDNNCNEEEKEYWDKYGKKIFEYSYSKHKYASNLGLESPLRRIIPENILADYKRTRHRNFKINKMYLDWKKEGFFETLIFSKDDCAEYGYNVMEAQQLVKMGGDVITGADEIPLSLFSKSLDTQLYVAPVFLEPESKNLISNYEDVSIEKSVRNQLEFAGVKIVEPENADIILLVNNFKSRQGEIVMKIETEQFSGELTLPEKPYMIADVRNANGADNNFAAEFFKKFRYDGFYGYSAWNTSANTLGSLICCAKVKFGAKKYNDTAFKKIQMIRLLDDWAYQANIRQQITEPCNIHDLIKPYEGKVSQLLDLKIKNEYYFPWNRLFEVEVSDELF
ncbi:MAG: DUF4127 family protein [Candidatus Gastranaerophilales bacterium]|nr:DUF4127 family protein [Candidatus Gastranaerophilales bacterium]